MSEPASPALPGGPALPVCPRHPGRESYVRCQRCERPVCPECQRPAAVGVQCVDCVKQQSRGARRVRTVFGGTVRGGKPRVTQGLIVACVLVYLLQLTSPAVTARFEYVPFLTLSEPWRLITVAFLHSDQQFLHIVFNMYALWLVGPYLEQLLGRARFIALYLLSALGASVVELLLADPQIVDGDYPLSWVTPTVGASGAVFGLFAAMVVVNRRLNRDIGQILIVIALNGAIGFFPGLHIAWQAHLGGLLTGAATAASLVLAKGEHRDRIQLSGLVGVAVLLAVLTAIKIVSVPAGAFA